MADALLEVELMEAEVERSAATKAEGNEELVAMRRQIEIRRKWIDEFVENWNRKRAAAPVGGASLDELRTRRVALDEHARALREQSQLLGTKRIELGKRQNESEDLGRRLDQMKALRDQRAAQLVGTGRITVADSGRLPTAPFQDRRKTMGVLGGALGAMAGVLLVLLLGLRDRRFRSTSDVDTLARLRLLGLMPALPADLADPRGREIAVHCVHQIRTLLQIGLARDRGTCLCVTGPGVGTGKTTLSLALGLSFGSSGTRTLLVDADLTGQGLTRRVGRMLFAHLRRVAEGGGNGEGPAAGPADASRRLLEPLVQRRDPQATPGPDEVLDLLRTAIDRLGADGARAAGVVEQVFALAALLFAGAEREALESRLREVADAGESPSAALPLPPKELRPDRPEFNGDPLDRYLYPTGIDALRFLPLRGLGTTGGVSAETVSRILDRVRPEFDVALVDTGPVRGAVETAMVAAHSDAVLLVVSPSDQRPEAERAVAQIDSIGTRIAGVVFNRAASRDVLKASRSRSSVAAEGGAR
jgi:Mrp family chromosome partitioning ATPase